MNVETILVDVTRPVTTQLVHSCAHAMMGTPCLVMERLVLTLMNVQLNHMVVIKPVSTWKDNTDVVVMLAISLTMT